MTFHVEASDDPVGVRPCPRARAGCRRRVQPGHGARARRRLRRGGRRRHRALHVDLARLLGPAVHARGARTRGEAERLVSCPIRSTAASVRKTPPSCARPVPACSSPAARSSPRRIQPRRTGGSAAAAHDAQRALELAERGGGRRIPTWSSVPSWYATARWWAEGWHERRGAARRGARASCRRTSCPRGDALRHPRAVRAPWRDAALLGRRRRGGRFPGSDRLARSRASGAGGGAERLRAAGVEVEIADLFEARRQNEAWRTWVTLGRPFVTLKVAVTLDGRAVPGERWVSGEESRRLVHELRAASDAVAVGMGTVRADAPGSTREAWRLRGSRGGSLRARPAARGLRARAMRRAARRRAAITWRRRCPVAAARGRPDARCVVPSRRPRGQGAALRRSPIAGAGPLLFGISRSRCRSRCRRYVASVRTSCSRRISTCHESG